MKPFSGKKFLFGIIAVLLPFMLLALVESMLRINGTERERQELFLPVPQDERFTVINPRFAGRYFVGFEPDVAPQPFLRDKPSGTRRYFVLGGSSVAGFPYHFYNGFPAYLEEALRIHQPGERVEVINVAMTAVNSFTIRDIHRQLLRFDPDGVLIYTGHNEFYGAFGAAVVPGWMRPLPVRRLILQLQNLHMVSMLTAMMNRRTGPDEDVGPEARTLMARMAEDRLVYSDEGRFREGISHFEKNIADVISTFHNNGIPVFISTVVSNEAGRRPLADDPVADDFFDKAVTFSRSGQVDSSRHYFRMAKERDPLRFRTPEAINEAIRRAGDGEGVRLVDAQRIMTPENIPLPFDPGYFTDHLHPDYRGYGLLAEAFWEAVGRYDEGIHQNTEKADFNHMGFLVSQIFSEPDPAGKILVRHTLDILKSDFPFVRDPEMHKPQQLHRAQMNRFRNSDNPAEQVAYHYFTRSRPLAESLAWLAGEYKNAGFHEEAVLTLRALHYLQPLNPGLDALIITYLTELSALAKQAGPTDRADQSEQADQSDQSDQSESLSTDRLAFTIPLWVRLSGSEFDSSTWPFIIEIMIDAGLFESAYRWLNVWESHHPDAEFYRLFARWHIRQGNFEAAQPWFREYYRQIR